MSPTSSNPANCSFTTHNTTHNGMTTYDVHSTAPPASEGRQPPAPHAGGEEVKEWVEYQLDQIGSTPVIGKFVLLGPAERRRGGERLSRTRTCLSLRTRDVQVYLH